MALFAQYAMASAEEALQDANWEPQSEEDLQATVRWQSTVTIT
jgi:3-oxoacyl-[acyl-carrier-protein] synthase II